MLQQPDFQRTEASQDSYSPGIMGFQGNSKVSSHIPCTHTFYWAAWRNQPNGTSALAEGYRAKAAPGAQHLAGLNSHSGAESLSVGGCGKAVLCLLVECSLCSLSEMYSPSDCLIGCDRPVPAKKLMSPKHLAHPSPHNQLPHAVPTLATYPVLLVTEGH